MASTDTPINWPLVCLGTIVRILFWGTTIYIVYLCIDMGYSKLMLHILFSTLGCGLLMVEATLVVTGDALLSRKLSRKGRVTIHWVLHILGLIALVIGFYVIYDMKSTYNSTHIKSTHAIVGLLGYLLPLIVAIAAIPTVWTKLLPKSFSLANTKYVHIYCGVIAYIFLWAGQITGFYKSSWPGTERHTNITIAAYVVGGFLLLAKPFYTTILRHCGNST